LPDRFVGSRGPDGGWSWEPADHPAATRPRGRIPIGPALLALLVLVAGGLGVILFTTGESGTGDLTILTTATASPITTPSPSTSPSAHASPTAGPPSTMEIVGLYAWDESSAQWSGSSVSLTGEPLSGSLPILLRVDRATIGSRYEVTLGFSACPNDGGPLFDSFAEDLPTDSALTMNPGPGRARPDALAGVIAGGGRVASWGALFAGGVALRQNSESCEKSTTLRFVVEARRETVHILAMGHLSGSLAASSTAFVTVNQTSADSLDIRVASPPPRQSPGLPN